MVALFLLLIVSAGKSVGAAGHAVGIARPAPPSGKVLAVLICLLIGTSVLILRVYGVAALALAEVMMAAVAFAGAAAASTGPWPVVAFFWSLLALGLLATLGVIVWRAYGQDPGKQPTYGPSRWDAGGDYGPTYVDPRRRRTVPK
jgi:hypothetical protein